MTNLYVPRVFHIQWHITERCNSKCIHCYQDVSKHEDLEFDKLLYIIDQIRDLVQFFKTHGKKPLRRFSLAVTGGEPFVRDDFIELLSEVKRYEELHHFVIMSNGHFLNETMVKQLKVLNPLGFQVSLDGGKSVHDKIRGVGSYSKTIHSIRLLVKAGIRTVISFTANKMNYKEFSDVVNIGKDLGVSIVWSDRLIPIGNGLNLIKEVMNKKETQEYVNIIAKEHSKLVRDLSTSTRIESGRALQFLGGASKYLYSCSAGDLMLTINSNGDIYPCRRMPIKIGNVLEEPLREIYYGSSILKELRQRSQYPKGCENCFYREHCFGGLKCLSRAIYGDLLHCDPGCWLETNDVNK